MSDCHCDHVEEIMAKEYVRDAVIAVLRWVVPVATAAAVSVVLATVLR